VSARRPPAKGKLLALRRQACPCGWPVPVGVRVTGLVISIEKLMFNCPECGRGLEMTGPKQVTGEAAG